MVTHQDTRYLCLSKNVVCVHARVQEWWPKHWLSSGNTLVVVNWWTSWPKSSRLPLSERVSPPGGGSVETSPPGVMVYY